jgi:ferredoxin-fold anticodon binding domain-containing protein
MTYSVFKETLEKEMNSIGMKVKKPKVIYSKKRQTGSRKSIVADKAILAMPSGKRISKTGKPYYEYRKNRTDIPPTRI